MATDYIISLLRDIVSPLRDEKSKIEAAIRALCALRTDEAFVNKLAGKVISGKLPKIRYSHGYPWRSKSKAHVALDVMHQQKANSRAGKIGGIKSGVTSGKRSLDLETRLGSQATKLEKRRLEKTRPEKRKCSRWCVVALL
jgi:hypothetical protein